MLAWRLTVAPQARPWLCLMTCFTLCVPVWTVWTVFWFPVWLLSFFDHGLLKKALSSLQISGDFPDALILLEFSKWIPSLFREQPVWCIQHLRKWFRLVACPNICFGARISTGGGLCLLQGVLGSVCIQFWLSQLGASLSWNLTGRRSAKMRTSYNPQKLPCPQEWSNRKCEYCCLERPWDRLFW